MTHTELRTRLSRDAFHEAVTAASRAPSMHNSQPWRFHLDEEHDAVQVRADRARTPPLADRSGWAMRVAGGAATYNLWLSLTVRARPYRVSWQPANADPDLLAVLSPAGGAALDAAARAELDETADEQQSGLVQPDVALPVGASLAQLPQHHQLGQGRQRDALPALPVVTERVHQLRRELEREALVAAAAMVVRADELVAGVSHQHRARDQLEGAPARVVSERPGPHVGDRRATVQLRERRLGGSAAQSTSVSRWLVWLAK